MVSYLHIAMYAGIAVVVAVAFYFLRVWIQGGECPSDARLDGKVVIITGCNGGIGKEIVLDLAERGAHIHMACRDYQKCELARQDIIAKTGNFHVYNRELDLASFESIRRFVAKFREDEERLDILINNAGIMNVHTLTHTKDGFEMHFGTNHLGHFLLTNLLLNMLETSKPSRIIIVSSLAHNFFPFDRNDLNYETTPYDKNKAYVRSKCANILMAHALVKRLKDTSVTVNTLHPGMVYTDLWKSQNPKILWWIMMPFAYALFKTPKAGAQTAIWCAVDPELENVTGRYFGNCQVSEMGKHARHAIQNGDAEWLWNESEKMIQVASTKLIV